MLGHKVAQVCGEQFETWLTVRSSAARLSGIAGIDPRRIVGGVDVNAFDSVTRAIAEVRPAAIVNCIGIVKQLAEAHDPIASTTVNSLFPHRVALLAETVGTRLIHLSTDCVFSGDRGMYREEDFPDARDLYGRTKLIGEVVSGRTLTLRTSMIGRALSGCSGLVEWFLSQRDGRVRGF